MTLPTAGAISANDINQEANRSGTACAIQFRYSKNSFFWNEKLINKK